MKATSRSFVMLALVVCLGATGACRSRTASQTGHPPQPVSRLPEPASAPPAAPEPPPPSPAVTAPLPEISAADCALTSEPGEPVATVGLGERVDPAHAPHPSNESERLLFRQLYETLLRVDCKGRVRPGLAASWRPGASGNEWVVTLRGNARFSDGTPVTALDVVSGWTTGGIGDQLRGGVRRLVRSILVVDDRTLEITLRGPRVDAPLALAHTDLAVARRVPGSLWPLGTRSARIEPDGETPALAGTWVIDLKRLAPEPASFDTPDDPFSLRFLAAPGRDGRDLLDAGVDLLVTRDPTVLAYAATLPEFVSAPLEWQRIHALLIPGRPRTLRPLSEEAREALADDAVRGEARGARAPFWWQSLPGCEVAYSRPRDRSPSTTGRVVYDGGDDAARDLAERLVGLVRASGPGAAAILDALGTEGPSRTYQRATGLRGEALASARRRGDDAAYILSLDRRPLDPCREIQGVVDDLGWVDPETIVPLVDTRMHAIVRRGRSGVTAEWDGGLLLVGSER